MQSRQSRSPETIEVLRSRLQQQDYYAATTLLTHFLRRWGYVEATELFKDVEGNRLAPGIWQAAIASLRSGPEQAIITDVLHSSLNCHLVTVAAGKKPQSPPHTYSVGLWHNFWHPELIAVGLPSPIATGVLGFYAEQIVEGRPPQIDVPLCGAATGDTLIQFKVCSARAKAEYMLWSSWFNSTVDYPALQMVWQDRDKRWPWEPDFSPRAAQPLLTY